MCSRSACAIFTYIPQALPRKHVSLHDLHSLQAEGGLWTSMYVSKLKGFDKVNWNYVSASQEFPRVQFLTYALHMWVSSFRRKIDCELFLRSWNGGCKLFVILCLNKTQCNFSEVVPNFYEIETLNVCSENFDGDQTSCEVLIWETIIYAISFYIWKFKDLVYVRNFISLRFPEIKLMINVKLYLIYSKM